MFFFSLSLQCRVVFFMLEQNFLDSHIFILGMFACLVECRVAVWLLFKSYRRVCAVRIFYTLKLFFFSLVQNFFYINFYIFDFFLSIDCYVTTCLFFFLIEFLGVRSFVRMMFSLKSYVSVIIFMLEQNFSLFEIVILNIFWLECLFI